jgi:hypothetical protein
LLADSLPRVDNFHRLGVLAFARIVPFEDVTTALSQAGLARSANTVP